MSMEKPTRFPKEDQMDQHGQGGLNLVFIALAILILIVAVIYLVNHT